MKALNIIYYMALLIFTKIFLKYWQSRKMHSFNSKTTAWFHGYKTIQKFWEGDQRRAPRSHRPGWPPLFKVRKFDYETEKLSGLALFFS